MSAKVEPSRIVLFTGVQRMTRLLRRKGFASACLQQPDEVVSSPEDVDIWIPYDPQELPGLRIWIQGWALRNRVVAVINRRERRVLEQAYLNLALGKDGINIRQAEILRDKFLMRETLATAASHLNPKYEAIDLTDASGPGLPYPFLLKPRNLFKSQLITLCENVEDWKYAKKAILSSLAATHVRHGVEVKPSFLAESYVQGQEVSMDALITARGETIPTPLVELTPARRWDMKDFHVAVRHIPAEVSANDRERALGAVRETVQALGLKATPLHVDMVLTKNRTTVLDVGPRIGGYRSEMMDLAHGCPLDPLNLDLAMGGTPKWQKRLNHGVAVVEVFPPQTGRLAAILGVEQVKSFPSFRRFQQRIPLGETVGWARDGFRCPIFIVLAHPDHGQVRRDVAALRRVLHLEVTPL